MKITNEVSVSEHCRICYGAGVVHPLKENGKPDYTRVVNCKCVEKELEKRKLDFYYRNCQLPPKAKNMTFENFKTFNEYQEAFNAALSVAEKKLKCLALIGRSERGKTHLAVSICNYWLEKGEAARYAYVPKLLDDIRKGYSNKEINYDTIFDFFCNVSLLVLDDLGTEYSTAWVQEKLDLIVDHRCMNELPLVITANLTAQQLPDRIYSRIRRMEGQIVSMSGMAYNDRPSDK